MMLERDAWSSLSFAFKVDAAEALAVSGLERGSIGHATDKGSRLTLCERSAAGAMILSRVRVNLDPEQWRVIQAFFTVPVPHKIQEKQQAVRYMAELARERLHSGTKRRFSPWWVLDVTSGFCGLRRHHTPAWWAEHMGRTSETVQRWENGGQTRPGLNQILERILSRALCYADQVLSDAHYLEPIPR